jgi:deoxyribodipyrimidine photo-lyase
VKTYKNILVWFRNDLRLHDHEALHRACAKGENIYPVYCFDPRWLENTETGYPRMGAARFNFLLETLQDLQNNLRALGSDLIFRMGKPEEVIPDLCSTLRVDALYTSKEVTSEETAQENAIEQKLHKAGIAYESFFMATLYHPNDLPYPVASLPDIFTQFRKGVEKGVKVRKAFPAPKQLNAVQVVSQPFPTLGSVGLEELVPDPRTAFPFKGGETAGKARVQQYLWDTDAISTYKITRNGLVGEAYSSKLSAWLANGSLSPRYIYEQIKDYEARRVSNESTYWLIFELIWRDYFRFVAKKYGNRIFLPGGIQQKMLDGHHRKQWFYKWAEGETGVPFIDANMKELNATGFMSNRGRQNVASFLVKDLKIDWIWGAAYFESKLVDYDPCSNWCNWNYVAGVGNDPRENRYFNIMSQAKQYDPKGEFVKLWLPQLKNLAAQHVHAPGLLDKQTWKSYGLSPGVDYPNPLVNFRKWL